ncbi:ABC transporter ATP-binding protein [Streptomyces sp. NPDC126499]|uniref:ABC transporter ATP-binding protein n=1 Tax=Streptomyces sp. NPDC126499 TaxID=3155314 RepID=UPI0033304FDA
MDGLRIGFADGEVVRGVSFDLRAGEVLALVGESGAGKSLTARALLGMLPRRAEVAGRVLLRGRPVTPADLGRRLAWIPQDAMSALSPVHRVEDQLAFAVRAVARVGRGDALAVARRALAGVGLAPDAAAAFPHALSGGMRQRAVIAMALVNNPDLVVADEPTTALDPERQERVLALLRERCAVAGAALLLVSHDLAAVRRHADRVAVTYAGRIVELGPAELVLGRPVAPYTRGLLASLPAAGLSADALPGDGLSADGLPTAGRGEGLPGDGPPGDELPGDRTSEGGTSGGGLPGDRTSEGGTSGGGLPWDGTSGGGLPRRPRLPVLAGAPPAPGAAGAGCAFAPRCPHAGDVCRRTEPAPRAVEGRSVACHDPFGEAA